MTIIYFIIAIGILIIIHELGHFIVAKRNDIRVEKFSIGFGPKIIGFTKGETEYKIAPIPLGGYVKMTGEDPNEEGVKADERSFAHKSVWTRIKVVTAGPLMNLALAFVLMPLVFMIGRMEPAYLSQQPVVMGVEKGSPAEATGFEKGDLIKEINGKKVLTWDDAQKIIIISGGQKLSVSLERDGKTIDKNLIAETLPELRAGYIGVEPILFLGGDAIIGTVLADGPASRSGLKVNDKILSIDNEPVTRAQMPDVVNAKAGASITIAVDRGGERKEFTIKPEFNKDFSRWMIGVQFRAPTASDIEMVNKKYGFVDAVKHGFNEAVKWIGLTFVVLKKLVTLQLSYKALGGPIQIAQASAAAAQYGFSEFIYFLAFLSIQLGILNLLPIPVLDGGHVLFCTIEAVIRKPLPAKVIAAAQYAGLALILTFFLAITVNDIDSAWGFKNILDKITGLFRH